MEELGEWRSCRKKSEPASRPAMAESVAIGGLPVAQQHLLLSACVEMP
jgi:hypothetical protein